MTRLEPNGFSTGSFKWQHFRVVSGQVATKTTGSDEDFTILFLDADGAWNSYGAPTKVGSCPKHGMFCSTPLHFNPLTRYWYLICPLCLNTYRYLNPEEKLDDLKIIRSHKTTALDNDVDVPWYWGY